MASVFGGEPDFLSSGFVVKEGGLEPVAAVFGGELDFLSRGFVVKEGFGRGLVAWSLWLRFWEGSLTS